MSGLGPQPIALTIPTPYLVGPVNLYLFEGEPLTLIDAGPRTADAWEALEVQLAQRGYRVADIKQVVLTHAHIDHYGLLNRVVETSGARVLTHPRSLWWLTNDRAEWRRREAFFYDLWATAGVPHATLIAMQDSFRTSIPFADALPTGAHSQTIDAGDSVTLGGRPWLTLHTPGHASSHISLYEPVSRQMISGDHLLLKISSNPLVEPPMGDEPRRCSLLDYMASMRRVAEMEVTVAWPGHGKPIYDTRGLIAERLAHHAERTAHVAALLRDAPLTTYALSERLFPGLPVSGLFLGLSEVIGHLDVLEAEGRLAYERRNGSVVNRLVV